MATTLRTLLNTVLATIGEDQVATGDTVINDTYHLQVLAFLNQIKEEVEAAHNWRAIRTTYTPTINAGQFSATLTGATERSRLQRITQAEGLVPVVFDVTSAIAPIQMMETDAAEVTYNNIIAAGVTSPAPTAFFIDNSAGDVMKLTVSPGPTGNRNYSVGMFTPQVDFTANDLSTVVAVPTRPILIGTVWYALQERGEELGTSSVYTEERYRMALDDCISLDAAESGDVAEMVPV